MRRTISIVTAVYNPEPDHLLAAYESVVDQDLPPGWSWEWLVQEDGRTTAAAEILPPDHRIEIRSGLHGGEAFTRNLGLVRSTGELIKNLDQDDQLMPGCLKRDIDALAAHPTVGWCTCRALDLLVDGSTRGFEHDPPDGRIDRGTVLEHWLTHGHRAMVHPTTLCIRRELAVALGGWMALPVSCDTGLLLAADAVSDGYFVSEVGLLYRKWPGQLSAQSDRLDDEERAASTQAVGDRAAALVALRFRCSDGASVGPVAVLNRPWLGR